MGRLLADGPRADARRNVERLVRAARDAVDEVGVTVTAHEIARRAGVGIGTFYRRVPSREALLEAVLADTIDEMIQLAEVARGRADVWAGFCDFAEQYAQLRTASCGVNEALGGAGGLALADRIAALRKEVRLLVKEVESAGELRTGLTYQDVAFALASVVPADHTLGLTARSDQWRRNLRVILDGLHAA